VKEKGILFSAPMARAILAGKKTVTRRLYKRRRPEPWEIVDEGDDGKPWPFRQDEAGDFHALPSPFGTPAARLWVRETWRYAGFTEDGYPFIRCRADDAKHLCERVDPAWSDRLTDIWAKLSKPANFLLDNHAADRVWRPAIFMPRWASRITLEVKDVRLELLHDISEEDADAEGVEEMDGSLDEVKLCARAKEMGACATDSRVWFAELWEKINGDRATWSSNPWVWRVAFSVFEPKSHHLAPPVTASGGSAAAGMERYPQPPAQQPESRLPPDDSA
jgi:hypothetical protein